MCGITSSMMADRENDRMGWMMEITDDGENFRMDNGKDGRPFCGERCDGDGEHGTVGDVTTVALVAGRVEGI